MAAAAGLSAVLLVPWSPPAVQAESVDLDISDGCYDSVAGAFGMFENTVSPAGGITLDVPGPVVQVMVEWMGEFQTAPADPDIGLEVNGTAGVITPVGSFSDPASSDVEVYAYYGDATSLFDDGPGTYEVEIAPPPDPGTGRNRWWGASVTVVYDTAPCAEVAELIWKVGADYYFGGGAQVTSEPIVYEFDEPLVADLAATVRMSHAGADTSTSQCRVSIAWAATGAGTPPTALVDDDGSPVAPGAVEAVVDPFTPPNQPCPPPVVAAPVVAYSGGHVGREYSLVTLDVVIPAGSTWFALQLESPQDNHGETGPPESGGWGGAGLMVITGTIVPEVVVEKTVLDGAGGTCPGVEGTDELVVGAPDAPVTYCFRVVNSGDTSLFPVTLDDADLGITQAEMNLVSGDASVPLAPGGELVYAYEATIAGDLLNTVTVTGTPVDDTGDVLGVPDITDVDDAQVDELLPPSPGIALEKTVLDGAAASCPGVEGTDELVSAAAGAPVTYCFRVTNTGDVALDPVVLDDPDLGIDGSDMTLISGSLPLAPGAALVYRYESVVDGDLLNTATVTGTVVGGGQGEEVTDTDDAAVEELVLTVDVDPLCDNDTPYLRYDIQADGLGNQATITFADGGRSESVVVPVGTGRVLWPGAVVNAAGDPTDWPGYDLDANGEWFLNPANPYAWARGNVTVTVTVNPTSDPITIGYPPAEPTCAAVPPPPSPAPDPTPPPAPTPTADLPRTGGSAADMTMLAIALLVLGAGLVAVERRSDTRRS